MRRVDTETENREEVATVYLNGGRVDTGKDAVEWARQAAELGAGEILLTSMDCDGVKEGYDLELTRVISERVNIPVIASGGAGKPEHFYDAFTQGKADAVLAASLFQGGKSRSPSLRNPCKPSGYLSELKTEPPLSVRLFLCP